jgi:hypothetical protein
MSTLPNFTCDQISEMEEKEKESMNSFCSSLK